MRTFIYIFGFLSLVLSPTTCVQQTNNNNTDITTFETTYNSQEESSSTLPNEIDPPVGTPKP